MSRLDQVRKLVKAIRGPDFIFLLLVILFSSLASRHLIFERGYFMMHDDLQMMRQLQMEKCFKDMQIPCRWVPDMAYGYGFPLFNFYPPLPYLVGELFRVVGFSFVETVKLTFALSIFLSGIFMYFFAKEVFGRLGGLLSSVFYVWAPYHSVDVFVRGAMNESWALVWFPVICYSFLRFIKSYNPPVDKRIGAKSLRSFIASDSFKYWVTLCVSWSMLLLSHNLMVLIFAPIFGLFCFTVILLKKRYSVFLPLVCAGFGALSLAAFFTIPAIFENKYTHVDSVLVGYYDYTAHFVSLYQLLISRFWGYGPSVWGAEADGMPFQVGHLHWTISIVVLLILVFMLMRNSKKIWNFVSNKNYVSLVLFFIFAGWLSAFMAHQKSAFLWKIIFPLKYLQFPWRFLTLTIFSFSFVSGALPILVTSFISEKTFLKKIFARLLRTALVLGLSLMLVILNWSYFRPDGGRNGAVTDEAKFSGLAWELQQTAGIYDYLPKQAKIAPNGPRKEIVEVMEGEVEYSEAVMGTNWATFKINVGSDLAVVRINIIDFPKWAVFVDGKEVKKYVPDEEMFGRFWVDVGKGNHLVKVRLHNTPIRTVSNVVSLASLLLLCAIIIGRGRSIGNEKIS